MALRQIVKEGDSVLTKKCRPVVKFDDRLADLIDDMIETLHKAEGVGLAAPQVGILRRVVVIDVGEGPIELVNPKIIAYSGKQETLEGCLSIPGKWGYTVRPDYVKVKALNERGEEYVLEGEGLLARCICHECDHLDGILYSDKAEGGLINNEDLPEDEEEELYEDAYEEFTEEEIHK